MPRIAVVTGASRGIGREIARQLVRSGWLVVAAQRTTSCADDHVKHVAVDLRDLQLGGSVDNFIAYLYDTLPHIDLLVNNSGICLMTDESGEDIDGNGEHSQWTDILNVNFYAVLRLTTALLPLLQKAPSGIARVVSISSGDGELVFFREDIRQELERLGCVCQTSVELERGVRSLVEKIVTSKEWACGELKARQELIFGGQEMYRLSKACVNAFVRMAARQLAGGGERSSDTFVEFVAVCPGDVATGMVDLHAQNIIDVSTAVRKMHSELSLFSNEQHALNGAFLRYGVRISW